MPGRSPDCRNSLLDERLESQPTPPYPNEFGQNAGSPPRNRTIPVGNRHSAHFTINSRANATAVEKCLMQDQLFDHGNFHIALSAQDIHPNIISVAD